MSAPDEPREVDIAWDLERRHFDEAEFVLELWEDTLDAPHYTLDELAESVEDRLLAHVDALAVGGPVVAERLLAPTLRDADAYRERVTVAVLACAGPEPVVDALREVEEPELARGLARGLELRDDRSLDGLLTQALGETRDLGLAAMLEVLANRGHPAQPWIARFTQHADPRVARAGAMLLRTCPDRSSLQALAPLAQSDDAGLRDAALDSALRCGVHGAWELATYWAFTPRESPNRRAALVWVALLGDAAAHARLLGLLDDPVHRVDALWAAGFTGSVVAARRCLALLEDDEVGPLAGESLHAIVELPTADGSLWRDRPTDRGDALPALQADNLDADLSLKPEYFLPIPEPEAIRRWWRTHEARFDPSCRYLYGRRFDPDAMTWALHHAPLRRRHNLAAELAARSQGMLRLSTRALTRVQLRQLEQLTSGVSYSAIDYQRGLPLR